MAIATTADFTMTRDQIIRHALRKVFASRDEPEAVEIENAAETLNLIVKGLQSKNVFLWTSEWTTQTLQSNSVVVGTDSLNYTCRRSHTAANSNKPVTGADYSTYWEQTGTGGAVWGSGTAYTSKGDFTLASDILRIEHAFRRRVSGRDDRKLNIVSKFSYRDEISKFQDGDPIEITFELAIAGPVCRLWPIPDATDYVIHMETIRKLKDFDNGENNPDFPTRWFEFLIFRLAHRLSYEYSMNPQERAMLKKEADDLFIMAKAGEFERDEDSFIEPA